MEEKKIILLDKSLECDNYIITYMKQDWFNHIHKLLSKHVDDNEFVVHFTSINAEYELHGKKLIIQIPLVFYTAKQYVDHTSIKFDLDDVVLVNDIVSDSANILAQEIKHLLSKARYRLDMKFTFSKSILNTIHKHQSNLLNTAFSQDDLSTDPKNPGIVFPFKHVPKNYLNTAIIIVDDHFHNTYEAAVSMSNLITEYRDHIAYEPQCSAVYIQGETQYKSIDKLLGQEPRKESYVINDGFRDTESYEIIKIFDFLNESLKDYDPSFLFDLSNIFVKE